MASRISGYLIAIKRKSQLRGGLRGEKAKGERGQCDRIGHFDDYCRRLNNHLYKPLGYAEATIESYSRNLDLFRRYLQDLNIADLRKVTHQVICDYQEKIMSEPIAMETKALKLRVVKRLFEYLVKTHRLLINPTEGIVETNRQNRKIGTVLTVAEVRSFLNNPTCLLRTGIRDRAMMEVLYCYRHPAG